METRRHSDSLQFSLPQADHNDWNITIIEYRRDYNAPTILCQFTRELRPGDLNILVMKPNLSVSTMFECVIFTEDVSSSIGAWLPIAVGLSSTCLLVLTAFLIKKYCSPQCVRQLRPAPDQDGGAAPYRSFGDSSHSNSGPRSSSPTLYATRHSNSPTYASYRPEPDRKYFKQDPGTADYTYLEERGVEERPYARI